MKKIYKYILLISFGLYLSVNMGGKLFGQGIFDYLYYGIKAGTNYSYFNNTHPHTSGKAGYSAGITIEMRRYHKLFIVTGVQYINEGGKFVQIRDNNSHILSNYIGSNTISLHNLDIPLYARLFLRNGKQFLPYFFCGPSLVVNLMVTNSYERTLHKTDAKISYVGLEDISSQYNQLSGYLNAGFGSEVLIANQSILFEVGYRYGLTPVNDHFSILPESSVSNALYLDGFHLNIAYNF